MTKNKCIYKLCLSPDFCTQDTNIMAQDEQHSTSNVPERFATVYYYVKHPGQMSGSGVHISLPYQNS